MHIIGKLLLDRYYSYRGEYALLLAGQASDATSMRPLQEFIHRFLKAGISRSDRPDPERETCFLFFQAFEGNARTAGLEGEAAAEIAKRI